MDLSLTGTLIVALVALTGLFGALSTYLAAKTKAICETNRLINEANARRLRLVKSKAALAAEAAAAAKDMAEKTALAAFNATNAINSQREAMVKEISDLKSTIAMMMAKGEGG